LQQRATLEARAALLAFVRRSRTRELLAPVAIRDALTARYDGEIQIHRNGVDMARTMHDAEACPE
jgi:hypothetical protein